MSDTRAGAHKQTLGDVEKRKEIDIKREQRSCEREALKGWADNAAAVGAMLACWQTKAMWGGKHSWYKGETLCSGSINILLQLQKHHKRKSHPHKGHFPNHSVVGTFLQDFISPSVSPSHTLLHSAGLLRRAQDSMVTDSQVVGDASTTPKGICSVLLLPSSWSLPWMKEGSGKTRCSEGLLGWSWDWGPLCFS